MHARESWGGGGREKREYLAPVGMTILGRSFQSFYRSSESRALFQLGITSVLHRGLGSTCDHLSDGTFVFPGSVGMMIQTGTRMRSADRTICLTKHSNWLCACLPWCLSVDFSVSARFSYVLPGRGGGTRALDFILSELG